MQLVQEAGFEGAEVEILTFSGDADFVDQPGLSEAVAGYLEAIGIKTFVSVVDGPVLRETFDNAIKTDEEIEAIIKDEPPYQIAVRGSDSSLSLAAPIAPPTYYHSRVPAKMRAPAETYLMPCWMRQVLPFRSRRPAQFANGRVPSALKLDGFWAGPC